MVQDAAESGSGRGDARGVYVAARVEVGRSLPMEASVRRSVRMPFRVRAGDFCVTGTVAIVDTPFLICGARVLSIGDILMLSLFTWSIRLMSHAAAHGKKPGEWSMLATQLPWRLELLHVPPVGLPDTQTVVDRPGLIHADPTMLDHGKLRTIRPPS